jgi:hypothetical protein
MFRFSIRELMLVTLVVAVCVGWFCHWRSLENRYQKEAEAANSYRRACETLRSGAESMDGMLIQMGFEIEEQGGRKSYAPPPGMPQLVAPPAGIQVPGIEQPRKVEFSSAPVQIPPGREP